ncbi:aldose 1-epimerase family protein [Streptomonospora sediminis]
MGDAIELAAGDYRAVVSRLGAGMCRLAWGGEELIWSCPPDAPPANFKGRLLAPWPNRIGDGRYTFQGAEHQLEINEPQRGTALHGLAHALAWLPVEIGSDRATLTCVLDGATGYPFRIELTASYELDAAHGLAVTIEARNTGGSAAPYGVGAHPYLAVDSPLDEAVLRLPAASRLPVDERLLPSGPPEPVAGTEHDFRTPRRVGATMFDTAFTDLDRGADGLAWTVLSADGGSAAVWADSSYGWLQVFSADGLPDGRHRRGLAVEPMTCPPDAFRSGTDLAVLEPGEQTRSRFGITRLAD